MKNKIIIFGIICVIILCITITIIVKTNNSIPKSEFTKCMEASQDRSCEIAYLETQGITDGIDCIMDYDNSICESNDRYNADVAATDECFGKKPNLIDCAELIK